MAPHDYHMQYCIEFIYCYANADDDEQKVCRNVENRKQKILIETSLARITIFAYKKLFVSYLLTQPGCDAYLNHHNLLE